MIHRKTLMPITQLVVVLLLGQMLSFNSFAKSNHCQILHADRVFDGFNLLVNAAVLFKDNKIVKVGDQSELIGHCHRTMDLGDATILPGFIESHAHLAIQNIPPYKLRRIHL